LRLLFFILILVGSSLFLYNTLSKDSYLRGADAYYYAVQAKYYATTGHVRIPDSSPVHRLTGALQKAGLSTEQAIRFWIVVSLFLFGLSAGGLVFLGRRPEVLSFLLLLGILLSPSLLFTAIEFPKIFSWLIFVSLWFYPLALAKKKWGLSILIALGSCLLHRAGLPIALLFSLGVFLTCGNFRARMGLKKILLTGLAFGLMVLFYVLIFKDRFHLFDLGRLSWEHLNLGFFSLLLRENLPLAIKVEMISLPLIFVFIAIKFWRSPGVNRREILLPCALILPAFFPMGSDEVFNAGERYAILLPALLWVGSLFLSTRFEPSREMGSWKGLVPWALALGAIPFLSPLRLELSHPLRLDPDYPGYDQVVKELEKFQLPMLIAQKNLVYFYDYKLSREAFPYEPEDHWNKERVWRLLYKIFPEELNYYLEDRCKWEGGLLKSLEVPDYTLIREDCWVAMRSKITYEENSDLYHRAWETWLNPSKKRPLFLYPKHGGGEGEFSALPQNKTSPPSRGGD